MRQEPECVADGGTRRDLLAGAGVVGLAGMMAACGGSKSGTAQSPPPETGRSSASSEAASPAPATKRSGPVLAKTSAIPVGGGKVFPGKKLVVTQPKKGEFKAFSAVCTHRGCTVASVSGGTINCPCHGSKYDVADASVTAGPAPRPLARRRIKVEGEDIIQA